MQSDTLTVITREAVALTVAWDEAWLLGVVFTAGATIIARGAWHIVQDVWHWASVEMVKLREREDAAV